MRFCSLALFLVMSLAGRSASGEALYLTWNGCPGGDEENFSMPCSDPSQPATLYLTFEVDQPLSGLIAIDFTVTFTVATDLGSFWEPECNPGLVTMDSIPDFSCSQHDPAIPGARSGIKLAIGGGCSYAGDTGRILGTVFTDPTTPTSLEPGRRYLAAAIRFNMDGATEAGGACLGCSNPIAFGPTQWGGGICLLPHPSNTQITLVGISNASEQAAIFERNILFNDCLPANGGESVCLTTPTLPTTWGALKVIYR